MHAWRELVKCYYINIKWTNIVYKSNNNIYIREPNECSHIHQMKQTKHRQNIIYITYSNQWCDKHKHILWFI